MHSLASVTLASVVRCRPRLESPSRESKLGIPTNSSDLLRELKDDCLVDGSRASRCGVLMLCDSGDCGILGFDRSARDRGEADLARVPLESTELEGGDLASDTARRFRVCESLVGCSLLETVWVRNLAQSSGGSSISKQSEDRINDAVRIVQV